MELENSIEGHYSLKNQFERSATSIGANIREANYAQSKADFISKLHVALKECYETEYWLELFVKANIVEEEKVKNLLHSCGELRRMLVSSITTLKSK
ncbi:MAG: four helix bundle protein [Clostridia bacterium]|nr:four helix bundle protein [Clostridia bacterium]